MPEDHAHVTPQKPEATQANVKKNKNQPNDWEDLFNDVHVTYNYETIKKKRPLLASSFRMKFSLLDYEGVFLNLMLVDFPSGSKNSSSSSKSDSFVIL